MYHPKTMAFDKKMKSITDAIDGVLEDEFGHLFPLRPNRPERGTTSNVNHDGLFAVQSRFTPGYGSEYGRGYLFEIQLSTLESVSFPVKEKIYARGIELLAQELKTVFPDKELEVVRDGRLIKIVGDLSLGSL